MGLTTQYLRYVPRGNVNLIADSNCNVVFVTLEGQEGRFVAVGACEHVYIWDLRLGEKVQVLSGDQASVTYLAASPNKRQLAAGYDDGSIKTYDLRSGENVSIFVGHHSAITCLAYDHLGHRLVSGSKDTDIIVWDTVAETGVCRLIGHKNAITNVAFMKDHNIIISSSKDKYIKFWDIENEFNFKTITEHKTEVWGFALAKDDQYLISGCNDNLLYVWKIYFADDLNQMNSIQVLNVVVEDQDDVDDMKYPLRCAQIGKITRSSKGRVNSLVADYSGQIVGCHGIDNVIELFHFLPEDQIKGKKSKRLDKLKKKAANDEKLKEKLQEAQLDTILKDQINRLEVIKIEGKAKSLDLIMGKGSELRVCSIANNNTIQLHSLMVTEKDSIPQSLRVLSSHGHRTDVRAICFSSDNLAFATASADSVKLWNRPTLQCIRTVEFKGYALCAIFVPGDRHLLVGLKDGKMLIIDITVGDILEEIPAHKNELWSIALMPSMKGIITGGGDKAVRIWEFRLVEVSNDDSKAKVLSVYHENTVNLDDTILCLRISPDSMFIAAALLNSNVEVYLYKEFLKRNDKPIRPVLSLYEHKLPVLCMDISSDCKTIVTGSADRNIKIWGMDFGDRQASLFAHDDSVTGLAFVPNTRYVFSCGKDGKIKQWDTGNWQKILTLRGHVGQAYNCAVSPNGVYVASCGSDRVVRIYEKTSEILVLEDEAEEEREKQELATGDTTTVPGQKNQILPTRKTVNSEKAAELILECLDICKAYEEECANVIPPNPAPPLPLLMQTYNCQTTEEFLLETVKRVRASDFDEALLLLPYSSACKILKMLPALLKNPYQAETITKLTLSLIQAHFKPIVTSQELLPQIEEIKLLALKQISSLRDTLGFNLHGMAYMQRMIEEKEGIQLFKEATKTRKKKNTKRKTKEKALKRAIMTL